MGLFSRFLARLDSNDSPTVPESSKAPDVWGLKAEFEHARARGRLIGAAILLLVGLIAFAVVFETTPRPQTDDWTIKTATLATTAADVTPTPTPSPSARPSAVATAPQSRLVIEPAASLTFPSATANDAHDAATTSRQPAESVPKVTEPAPVKADDKTASNANDLTSKDSERIKTAATDSGRYVVQVGAFADASGARTARKRIDALGMQSYTQVVETASGRRTRVRVGPFEQRQAAQAAANKLKAAGMTAAVLRL